MKNLLTVATAPGCQTQRWTATASYSQIAGPRSPRVFVVKPQHLISPVAKVPQAQVKGKGEKFNIAYHKFRLAVGRPRCRLASGLAVIYSFCLLSASHVSKTPHSYG
jgi:hypothetical protein